LEELRRREHERRQREEEMQRQQQAEMERKRHEEEKRRIEATACLAVRKTLQKLRLATPETVDSVTQEVSDTMVQELYKCGTQADRIKEEAEKTLEQTRQRVESIREQRRKEEETRVEDERLRKEQEDNARKLWAELAELVGKAENDGDQLRQVGKPLSVDNDLSLDEAKTVGHAVREVGHGVTGACRSCTNFIMANRCAMEKELQSDELRVKARDELVKLQSRIQEIYREIITLTTTSRTFYSRALTRSTALTLQARRLAAISKYDEDGDGELSAKEILAYAEGEFDFVVQGEAMAKILRQLAGTSGCVPKDKLQRLKMAVGIAREEENSRLRIVEAELRRQATQARKKELETNVATHVKAYEDLEQEIRRVEEFAQPLSVTEFSGAEDIVECTESVVEKLTVARAELAAVKEQVARLCGMDTAESDELKAYVNFEARRFDLRAETCERRFLKVDNLLKRGHEHLAALERTEVATLRKLVASAIKGHATKLKLSPTDLVKAADKDVDGAISSADFVTFVGNLEAVEASAESLRKLFTHLEGKDDKGALTKDAFLRLSRVYYRVVQSTVLTTARAVSGEDSRTKRRLDDGEVLELLEGPVLDDDVGLTRVRVSAVRDALEGWATVVGNAGSIFLEEGGNLWKVVCSTMLSKDADIDSADVRELAVGELLELLGGGAGPARMKVLACLDGKVGWATRANQDGKLFLEFA